MPKYKAAIFDLDGTLLNTLDDLRDSMNHTMEVFGLQKHTTQEIREYVGNGVRHFAAKSVHGGYEHPQFEEIVSEYMRYYSLHSNDKTAPYSGIFEMIKKIQEHGIKVAVVSNKSHSATIELCKRHFSLVNTVVGEQESNGLKRKPAPDMVIYAAELLGVDLSDCVYVGDSEVDVITAKNTGIDCISVLWGFRDREILEANGGSIFVENVDQLFSEIIK